MKTISKSIMSLGLSMLVGGAFAQTTDQEKDKSKDHMYKDKNKQTSQLQDSKSEQDFSSADANRDGQLDEDEFVVVYTEVYSFQDTTQNQSGEYSTTDQHSQSDQSATTGQETQGTTAETYDQSGSDMTGQSQTQNDEFISSRFEKIDEDSNGYIDEQEFESWKRDSGTE